MIQVTPPQNTDYWINQRALSFAENDLDDPNRVAVSLVSGTVIMVYKRGVIDFAADGSYQKWVLKGYSTKIPDGRNEAHYVYARLNRNEKDALIVFSINNYNIDGSIVGGSSTPSETYWYIKIGYLTETDGDTDRVLTYDSGLLGTKKGEIEADTALEEMFVLHKESEPPLIEVKHWFQEITVKLGAVFMSGLTLQRPDGVKKTVTDIKRSIDDDDVVPISDKSLPTTSYLDNRIEGLDDKYLRKDKDDRSVGYIASDRGFEAGKYVPEATGAACYKDEDGNWHIETDHLRVRKKAVFTEIEVQEVHHVGGQMLLTAASMVVDYVFEMEDRYRCYFRKVDSDGREIENTWMAGDQAYCCTFNLTKQADGSTGTHYLWRLVLATNATKGIQDESTRTFGDITIQTSDYNFTDLSKSACAIDSDAPAANDEIVSLGYQGNDRPERQNAIIIAGAGENSPYIYEFVGIGNQPTPFSLPEPETRIKPGDNMFTGIMRIQGGSTGASNLEDFPEEVFKAVQIGTVNLLRNSGFTGDYKAEDLNPSYELKSEGELYSKGLKHWAGNATVNDDDSAVSGKSATLGSLSQTVDVIKDESYVVSFKAKGSSVSVSLGGQTEPVSLKAEYDRYTVKFVSDGVCTFSVSGEATVCDLQLERGTIATDWSASPYDNNRALAEFQALKYIQDAIQEGDTTIIGGLILSSMIMLGNYKDGKMQKVNAGMSGVYNDDDDVAFWGGGTLEQAILTATKFRENPRYIPEKEEWDKLANFVVTHGGQLSLKGNVFADNGYFRGDVYANSGYFNGEVNAESGVFKNVRSPNGAFVIDEDGNVDITGLIQSNSKGNRIIVNPQERSLSMFASTNTGDIEVARISFESGSEIYDFGEMVLKQYNVGKDEFGNERPVQFREIKVNPSQINMKIAGGPTMIISNEKVEVSRGDSNLIVGLVPFYELSNQIVSGWRSCLRSNSWPSSSDQLASGEVYVDNGILKVKQ